MTSLDELIAQIPLRHNLISYMMFTGALVGFVFAILIWVRAPGRNRALHYYSLLNALPCIPYSGYFSVLYRVDEVHPSLE